MVLLRRKAFPTILAMILAMVIALAWWTSWQRGLGALIAMSVEQQVDHWNKRKEEAGAEVVLRLQDGFEAALRYTPDDPHLLEYGAKVRLQQAALAGVEEGERRRLVDEALEYYRESLRRRPAWPYTWMGFAKAKAVAGELDKEFSYAFRTALRLGPAEEVIRDDMVELGLRTWPALDLDNRDRVLALVRSSLSADSRALWRIVRRTDRLPLVCLLLDDDERAQMECAKADL